MRFYVASKFHNYESVRAFADILRAKGHEITYDWTRTDSFDDKGVFKFGNTEESDQLSAEMRLYYAGCDLEGACSADAVVLLWTSDMCGAYMEAGMALASGKSLYVIGSRRWTIFYALPNVRLFDNAIEFWMALHNGELKESPSLPINLTDFRDACHKAALDAGWYKNKDGTPKQMNKGERLMLMVSEISEAMEGERKNLMDDKLPHRPMAEVELADCLIRIFDYCGEHGYDIEGAVREKMAYNAVRPDHKIENREKEGGKQW